MDLIRIRQTIETYMFGVDAKNLQALLSCFTEDAQALYHRGTVDEKTVAGGEPIARGVFESCSRFSASNHSISNFVATVDGDSASANTFAIANVIIGAKGLVRGLRYEDHLVRVGEGWVIDKRVHTPLWQSEVAIVTPVFF